MKNSEYIMKRDAGKCSSMEVEGLRQFPVSLPYI